MKSLSFAIAALFSAAVARKVPDGNKALIGTNLGGWLVLEPWITPSLFYRFLGKTQEEGVAWDSYTLCETLGAEEGNKLMRAHWDAWVTEQHIADLAAREVELLRLPIGDWNIQSYAPYTGCMDGADEKIQWLLDTAAKYNLKVLLDVHGVKGSQNGFDNSGMANRVEWLDDTHFDHRSHVWGEWMGTWNGHSYDSIVQENIDWAVNTVDMIVDRWGTHPALYAIEPVNEPWLHSDMPTLKSFYRTVRENMRQKAPHLVFVFHDAFQFLGFRWNDLFDDDDMENVVMDTHFYTFFWPRLLNIREYARGYRLYLDLAKLIKYPVWVGEWSLATDSCATWLQGFNDSASHMWYRCHRVDCPQSYLPDELAVDFDRTAKSIGPFGTGEHSYIKKGRCTIDSNHFKADDVAYLGQYHVESFNKKVDGQLFWNFRNELEDRWNYVTAYDNGWFNQTASIEDDFDEEFAYIPSEAFPYMDLMLENEELFVQ